MKDQDPYRVPLANVGYACIRVNRLGRISGMNSLAEALTGQPLAQSKGLKLESLVRLVNASTHEALLGNPLKRLPLGQAASLPPDTHLLNRAGLTIGTGGESPPEVETTPKPDQTLLIFRDATRHNRIEKALLAKSNDLSMRFKGLTCLYAISELLQNTDLTLEDALQGIVNLMPAAWQFPDIACARITWDEHAFLTDNYVAPARHLTRPIRFNNAPGGEIEIGYLKPCPAAFDGPFLREEKTLLNVIGEHVEKVIERKQTESALARARRHQAEIGWKIQQTLLLGSPPADINGLQVAAMTIPSQSVDGDFYDFFKHSDTCLDLVIGDVMGKGIPGALLGAGTKTQFLKTLTHLTAAPGALPAPETIVQAVHDRMVQELIGLHTFVTLCYARFDLTRMRLFAVDCGHTKTIHYQQATGACSLLQSRNVPLGFYANEIYHQLAVDLAPGDVLFFYSDGITEARNREGDFFGVEQLTAAVRESAHLTAEELIHQIVKTVTEFARSELFGDDLTCTAVKITDETAAPLLELDLETTSELDRLDEIRAFTRDFCNRVTDPRLKQGQIWELELALHEVSANVMQHAYGRRPGQPIGLKARLFDDRIVFRLTHTGDSFVPEATSEQQEFEPGETDRRNGFGLFIIDQCVDQTIYTRDDRGANQIWLIKHRTL